MLQSSLEKLIHSALFIFSNPDTQPWSILHAELLEDKVILRFFFWMLLVDYSKVDVYGNHKGFFHVTPFMLNRQIVLFRKNEHHRGREDSLNSFHIYDNRCWITCWLGGEPKYGALAAHI